MSKQHQGSIYAKYKNGVNKFNTSTHVDDTLLVEISQALEDNELLKLFIKKGSLSKSLKAWSFLSSVNDHARFADFSTKLCKISYSLASLEMDDSMRQTTIDFYKELLKDHSKYVYRALSVPRYPVSSSVLDILRDMTKFDSTLLSYFLENFDLTLPVLPKLLVPTKRDFEYYAANIKDSSGSVKILRYHFIHFWITLCSRAPSYSRSEILLQNVRIMNNFWNYNSQIDSDKELNLVFDFILEKILKEPNFKRSTKCKILNDNFMFKILQVYSKLLTSENKMLLEKLEKLLYMMTTDISVGLVFPSTDVLQEKTDGVNVTLNNKKFKINNKLLLTFLTYLKPSENIAQVKLAISILKQAPELIPPYMNWIVQNGGGYHDPSLSSWWISYTLLYTEILKLSIHSKSSRSPSTFLLVENVILAPLSKGILSKLLEAKSSLVRQFGLQLLMYTLLKLGLILQSYKEVNNTEFIETVTSNLPDYKKVIQILGEKTENSNNNHDTLSRLTSVSILTQYQKFLPIHYPNLPKLISNKISSVMGNSSNNTSLSLSMLDSYLSIQLKQQEEHEYKWWNRIDGGNSLFVYLLQMSSRKESKSGSNEKFLKILIKLTEDTLFFNQSLCSSILVPIVHSLKEVGLNSKIWNLFNEATTRAKQSGYKYLDLAHQKYDAMSMYTLVLFDQFKFTFKICNVEEKKEMVSWVRNFIRVIILCNENKDDVLKAFTDLTLPSINDGGYGDVSGEILAGFENGIPCDQEMNLIDIMIRSSNQALSTKYLKLSNKVITSTFEFSACLVRLSEILINNIQGKSINSFLCEITERIGDFACNCIPTDSRVSSTFYSKKLWSLIFETEILDKELNKNQLLVGEMLSEIFYSLKEIYFKAIEARPDNNLSRIIEENIFSTESLPATSQVILVRFLWMVPNKLLLRFDERINIANENILLSVLKELSDRKISLNFNQLSFIIKHNCNEASNAILKRELVSEILKAKLVIVTDDEISISKFIDLMLVNNELEYLAGFLNFPVFCDVIIRKIYSNPIKKIEERQKMICFMVKAILHEEISIPSNFLSQFNEMVINTLDLFRTKEKFLGKDLQNLVMLFIYSLKNKLVSNDGIMRDADIFFKNLIDQEEILFDVYFAILVHELISFSGDVYEPLKVWISRVALFITKKIAESLVLDEHFLSLVISFDKIIFLLSSKQYQITKIIGRKVVCAQIESIINHKKLIKDDIILAHVNHLIVADHSALVDESEKFLQILLNNDSLPLKCDLAEVGLKARFEFSMLLLNIYRMNKNKNSTLGLIRKILEFYNGGLSAEDLILKNILINVEEKLRVSWLNLISGWQFNEELSEEMLSIKEQSLIMKDNTKYFVTLNHQIIKNTVRHHGNKLGEYFDLPSILSSDLGNKIDFRKYIDSTRNFFDTNKAYVSIVDAQPVYDPELLMLLIINSPDFTSSRDIGVEKDSILLLNPKLLAESGILQLMVVCASHNISRIRSLSKILLDNTLKACTQNFNFKDSNIIRVYISSILYTYEKSEEEIPRIVWHIYAMMIPILINPGHYLYEKCCRYILSHPFASAKSLPLNGLVMKAQEEDEDANYSKEVSWFIDTIVDGTKEDADFQLLKNNAVEWMLNLLVSSYTSKKIQHSILRFIYTVQYLPSGSTTLATKFSVFSFLDQMKEVLKIESIDNPKLRIVNDQLILNIKEITLRWAATSGTKRLLDWTSADLPEHIKRIHRT